jgi:hypothetical protein
MKKSLPFVILLFIVLFFSRPFFLQGKLPIPADTIIGLYHPFRDLYARDYPRGIPFKNFLITDPVRQQFPWRVLSIDLLLKQYQLPLWNPYNLAGTPLSGNLQGAAYYPLNILFIILPFNVAWCLLIFLQPLLAGMFLYMYMKNLKIHYMASLLSAFVFAFSGFSIAWLEWNTIIHTALWLPLILLAIDKLVLSINPSNSPTRGLSTLWGRFSEAMYKVLSIKNRDKIAWSGTYLFAIIASFFAGHLQTFFYLFLLQFLYFISRWLQNGRKGRILLLYFILNALCLILTFVQWYPTLQLILLSARGIDVNWLQEGWFIPWQNLIQFIVPDFFGNPATLNYWGVWNYGEFIGYVGIFPLIMALYALFTRYDRKTFFYGSLFFFSLVFSLPSFISKMPFILNIPFISTAQPTRLLFLTNFSLAILAGLGLDYFLKAKNRIMYVLIFIGVVFAAIWYFLLHAGSRNFHIIHENIAIAQRNTFLPSILFICITIIFIAQSFAFKKYKYISVIILIIITIFDLLRFADKFIPFTNPNYLFPLTNSLTFLKENTGYSRIMSTDSSILPPNFSIIYRLQSINGYDPLYLKRYGELIAASERGKPDVNPPFGFNRIITPHIFNSKIINLMGVKYILSLTDLSSPQLKKVFQEGETRIYRNWSALPRTFFIERTQYAAKKQDAIQIMFNNNVDFRKFAVIEDALYPVKMPISRNWTTGTATITEYKENKVVIETNIEGKDSNAEGFLVLTDSFYPTWHAKIIDNGGLNATNAEIFRTDYNFRGVIVPQGKHKVIFYDTFFL